MASKIKDNRLAVPKNAKKRHSITDMQSREKEFHQFMDENIQRFIEFLGKNTTQRNGMINKDEYISHTVFLCASFQSLLLCAISEVVAKAVGEEDNLHPFLLQCFEDIHELADRHVEQSIS